MLLVDPILEIFHLTNTDGDTMFLIVALDSSFIGLAAVSGLLAAESVTWPLGRGGDRHQPADASRPDRRRLCDGSRLGSDGSRLGSDGGVGIRGRLDPERPFRGLQRIFPAHCGERRIISEGYWNSCP